MTIQEKIAMMQTKRQPMPRVFQRADGTWGNRYEFHARYEREADAAMAARWAEEWGCK